MTINLTNKNGLYDMKVIQLNTYWIIYLVATLVGLLGFYNKGIIHVNSPYILEITLLYLNTITGHFSIINFSAMFSFDPRIEAFEILYYVKAWKTWT
jgi:hypothetical protein